MDFHQWIQQNLPSTTTLESRFDRLWPICRSLTGDGVRETFAILRESIPLEMSEVKSGTKVYDWTVPKEWNISEAYIEDESGKRWIDFGHNNLHVLGYSLPVDQWLTREELEPHLYSLPDQPDAIPYLTSYYAPRWGFCLSEKQKANLPKTKLRAVIRSSLTDGTLSYAQLTLPATVETKKEFLISTYICHPSLANNELSGPLVATAIYEALKNLPVRKYNYRFVFVPETIGSITFLSQHGKALKENCVGGLVVTCCGDGNKITFEQSRRANTLVDKIALHILEDYKTRTGKPFTVVGFCPSGSDGRQYCSPGFNLPVGSLMRSMYGTYPEYHTSLDNKAFISFAAMRETVQLYLELLLSFAENEIYLSTNPNCEPMLSPRGLYPSLGSQKKTQTHVARMMYVLSHADGEFDLLSIAQRARCSVLDLAPIANQLIEKGLLVPSGKKQYI